MTVKLAGKLPAEDSTYNGLEAIRDALIAHPRTAHVVIALVDCKTVTTETDTGTQVPTARVVHVEVMAGRAAATAEELLTRTYAQRTGREQLPID